MTRVSLFATVLCVAAGAAVPAGAQSMTPQQFEAALNQRDQEIAALEKRIGVLEARLGDPKGGVQAAASSALPAASSAASDPGAGEAELQALSRGLVQRGLLLLPKGSIEVSPSLAYSHTQKQGVALVDTPEGISTVSDQRLRDDGLEGAVAARLGLPWNSQVQVRVPLTWKREAVAVGSGAYVRHSDTHVGDVDLELSHQLLVEKGWVPGLTAAVSWRFPTGSDPFQSSVVSLASGGGTHAVTGRITAFKSVDPLVLFSSVSYSANLSRQERFGRVRPGNAVDWQMGALLAVSPETSLSFGFAQDFKGRTFVDGKPIAGSDGVAAIAQVGLDQVLSSRALLDVSLGVGITNDAPDYQLLVSVPIRFR